MASKGAGRLPSGQQRVTSDAEGAHPPRWNHQVESVLAGTRRARVRGYARFAAAALRAGTWCRLSQRNAFSVRPKWP